MTRKEYDEESQNIRSQAGGYGNVKSSLSDMTYYVDELEQRIAELQEELAERISESNMYCKVAMELEAPKTCDGCKYHNTNAHLVCMHCNRDGEDLYEAKDSE